MKKILILLAEGFEEIEAVTPIDFLRRLNFIVDSASIEPHYVAHSSHGIKVKTDSILPVNEENYDALILPGGMPGSVNLRDSALVIDLIKSFHEKGKLIASICASPIALNKAGILKNVTHTAHPSVKDTFLDSNCTDERVVVFENIITAKGPGTTAEFAKAIASYMGAGKEAQDLYNDMFFN